jgi:alpha-beta hydrolase superfamily lysophospholipase
MDKKSLRFNSGESGTGYYHQWTPESPKAWVHIMHGMAEHSARYAHIAEYLNQHGIMVTADDHRGHGLTGEAANSLYHNGDKNSWNQMIDDQWQLINHIASEQQLPLIIMGHSMGSFMATRFCQIYGRQLQSNIQGRLRGLVLSGSNYDSPAAFKIAAGIAWIERARLGVRNSSNLLEKLSFGSFNRKFTPQRTDRDWLSSDPAVVDSYIADPLCGGALSTASWYDFIRGLSQLSQPAAMAKIDRDLPVYVFSGALDPVGGYGKGVVKLEQALLKAGLQHVELKLYDNGRHEMLNEINKQDVYKDLTNWLQRQL